MLYEQCKFNHLVLVIFVIKCSVGLNIVSLEKGACFVFVSFYIPRPKLGIYWFNLHHGAFATAVVRFDLSVRSLKNAFTNFIQTGHTHVFGSGEETYLEATLNSQ